MSGAHDLHAARQYVAAGKVTSMSEMYSLFKVTDKLICHFYILNYFAFPFKFYISELDFVRSHPSANTETAHHKEKVLQSVHH